MLHRTKMILILLMIVVFSPIVSEAALLQGTVTLSTGTGFSGVTVTAYGMDTGAKVNSSTDGNGYYSFNNLPQGRYRLYFDASLYNRGTKWYGSATCGGSDSIISLTTTFVADMVFEAATTGIVTGTVTDNTGKKLAGIEAEAFPAYTYYSFTDANGQYSLSLPIGTQDIYFYVYNSINHTNYLDMFHVDSVAISPNSVTVVDAVLGPAASISGMVKDSTGTPISNALVTIYNSKGISVGTAHSDLNGAYTIGNLFSGTHKVFFQIEGTTVNTWYGNKNSISTATPVSVVAGLNTSNIDAVMANGSISGLVTNISGGAISNVTVKILDTNLNEISSKSPDANGSYRFILNPGDYKIYFQSPYLFPQAPGSTYISEWFNNGETPATADLIHINDGTQAVANAILGQFGSISGTVSSIDKGVLAGTWVYAYNATTGELAGSAVTDSNGLYSINLIIPGGQYKVRFSPPKSGYIPAWYNDQKDFQSSPSITVQRGSTTSSVNTVLKLAGAIAGTVFDATGAPMPNVTVSTIDPISGLSFSSTTDVNGNYTLYNLSSGNYAVYFSSFPNMKEYYNHKPDKLSADFVSVTAPSTTSGINATLRPTGSISGNITILPSTSTFTTPTPVTVTVYDSGGNSINSYTFTVSAYSSTRNYTYSVPWLESGTYKVRFSYGLTTIERWFNQGSAASATDVSVTAPFDTPNINVDFASGGTISGTVFDLTDFCSLASNTNIADNTVSVCAFDVITNRLSCVATTSGTYSITNLPAGNYKVLFKANNNSKLLSKWNGGSNFSSATIIPVQSTSTVSGINMVFSSNDMQFGIISGKASDANGNPENVNIYAYDSNNVVIQTARTDYLGRYTLTGLPPGTYKLMALGDRANHFYGVKETIDVFWYDNKADYASATTITIAANETVTANFAAPLSAPHTVTVSVEGSGGTISPSGSNTVTPGNSLTVSISPWNGYQVSDVKIDGISVGAVTSYTFSALSKDSVVIASFRIIPQPPVAPIASFTTSQSQSGFTANWGAVADVTGYYLDVSTSSSFDSFVAGFNNKDISNVTTYAVSGVTAGTTYFYRVRAYNAGGSSINSNTITTSTLPFPPIAPTASTGTAITQTGFTANWGAATGATGYYLDISTSSSFASFVSGFNSLDISTAITYSVDGLTAGTTYYFRVRAYNSGGTSVNSATQTITLPATQTISFTPPTAKTYGDAAISLSATGGASGNPVTYSVVSGPGTVSGTNNATLTITGAGTIVVKASQAGSTNYAAAPDVTASIVVSPKSLTITANNTSRAYGAANPANPGFAVSGLAGTDSIGSVSYTYAASATATASVGTTHALTPSSAIFSSGAASNYTPTYVDGVLTIVGTASQTISFTTPTNKTYGDAPITLSATASSGLPVSLTLVSGSATLNGTTLTITGAGSIVVKATQAGDSNYSVAPEVQQTITVNKAIASIALDGLSQIFNGSQKNVTATTTPPGLAYIVLYEGSGVAPTNAGTYGVVVSISDNNYSGTASGNLVIANAPADITAPEVSNFTILTSSTSLTVPVSAFTATDAGGVTGYLISESATPPQIDDSNWFAAPQTTYEFTSQGTKVLYAFAKDSAGNISVPLSASVTITMPDVIAPKVTLFTLPATANSLTVPVTALAATDDVSVSGYLISESATQPQSNNVGWTAILPTQYTLFSQGVKTLYAFAKDATGNISAPLSATVTIFLPDVAAPVVTDFTIPANANTLIVPISTLAATDDVGVSKYLLSESGSQPQTNDPGWSADKPVSYTFLSQGTKTIYVFAKDAAGNISAPLSASVAITLPDTIAPVVASFTIPAATAGLTVPVSSFSATDAAGVTGYFLSDTSTVPLLSDSRWTTTPTSFYTFATAGVKTLFAFAKDAAGNISAAASAPVAITLADTVAPTVTIFTMPATATNLTVPVTTFTASDNTAVTGYFLSESLTAPLANTFGWSSTAPNSYTFGAAGSFTLYAFAKDAAGNISSPFTASITITLPDMTVPTISTFVIPTTASSLTVPVTTFTATDNVAVTGYLLSEESSVPMLSAQEWVSTPLASHTFNTAGNKTLYAFAKDAAGNVSSPVSGSVTITLPAIGGSCGSSHGQTLSIAPTTNLCTTGQASTVTGSGPWNWACNGTNGGTNATCSTNSTTQPSTPLKGDINGDGTIDISDALLALQYALNLVPHTTANNVAYLAAADVAPLDTTTMKPKGNGTIDVMDALVVLQRSVNLLSW